MSLHLTRLWINQANLFIPHMLLLGKKSPILSSYQLRISRLLHYQQYFTIFISPSAAVYT